MGAVSYLRQSAGYCCFVIGMSAVFPVFSQQVSETVDIIETVDEIVIAKPSPTEALRDFMHAEEGRVCSELRSFAKNNILNNQAFTEAAENRSTKGVTEATSRFALGLAKDYSTDYLFYYPNTRFFVRVNDQNYRGRMRLPSEVASSSSACFWERLPSDEVAYSVLLKIDGEKTGYLKMSKTLPNMIVNVPDALSEYGKVRVYTALDKIGLNKMAWFKMRRREANPAIGAGWCTTENLAFLSAVGPGKKLPKKTQKKVLSLVDKDKDFTWDEMNLSGGTFPIKGLDEERLGVVVYTLENPPEKISESSVKEGI